MARVTVSISNFTGNQFVSRQIASIRKLSERQIEEIAKETARVIKQKITERIKREGSTGNLANSFYAFPLTPDGWGVGDISYLDQHAPYWYWQNYGVARSGRKVPPRSTGIFSDGTAPNSTGGTARWQSPGLFYINPTKPIEPKNYIQATVQEINQIVRRVVGRIRL